MSKKEKFLASAQKHLERGSLDKALADYQKAAEDDPKDTRVWLKIAELQVKRGRKEDARDVYLKTAEIYTEQGFFQRAVAVYKNLLKLTPGFVDAHFKLADLFRQLGLLSDAMQQYELAAAVYQKLGKVAEAMGAMRKIVDLNPDHVLARIKLAEAASSAGLKDEAIASFRQAAEQLRTQGRSDEFLRVAERLLAHAPNDLAFAKEVAAGYIERGNARFALAKLQPCFAADPRDLETLALLAKAFEQLGQVAKTLSVTKEIGRIHRDAGRMAEALAAFQKAAALDPSDDEARNEVTRAQASSAARAAPSSPAAVRQAGKPSPFASITFSEMAIPQFLLPKESSTSMPAITMSPEAMTGASRRSASPTPAVDTERLISEADLFIKYNLFDRAVEHVRRVFDQAPDHPGARERLAYALVQLGRHQEAATQYALLGELFRFSDPARSSVYMKQAAATRPQHEAGDQTTETGNTPEFSMSSTDTSGEVLDFESLDAEFIEEDDDDEAPASVTPALLSLSDLASQVNARTDKVSAYKPEPGEETSDDWAPPTSEMTLPSFDEFDRVERTSAEGFSEAALSADLEQVDFFINEGLADEAQSLLDDLVTRYPRHPAVAERFARLRDLSSRGAVPQSPPHTDSSAPRAELATGESADSATHADLGVAYKEMGLFDAAIKEFKVLSQDPDREIDALIMIGECYEGKNALPDAVIHYKKALNRAHISDAQATQIYFQLGRVFEALGDGKEALYFFEKVVRRNPNHADVSARVARLGGGGGASKPANPLAAADSASVNVALDAISGGNRSRS
ncbi:MAG: tetratricopeptide repeat protein [Deltaproteobacteria bacterium]|nr:tetratricopeptide repeat protein [Deltaproteobacteria bacterium]